MVALIFPERWLRKPSGPQELDLKHPLAQDLRVALLFNERAGKPIEMLRRRRTVTIGTAARWTTGDGGAAQEFSTSRADYLERDERMEPSEVTLGIIAERVQTFSNWYYPCQKTWNNGVSMPSYALAYNVGAAGQNNLSGFISCGLAGANVAGGHKEIGNVAGPSSSSRVHSAAVTYDQAVGRLYANGRQIAAATFAGGPLAYDTGSGGHFLLNSNSATTVTNGLSFLLYEVLVWGYALPPAALREWNQFPYVMFRPRPAQRSFFVLPSTALHQQALDASAPTVATLIAQKNTAAQAPAFVAAATATGNISIVVTKPGAVQDGDLLVAGQFSRQGDINTQNPPAGWTEVFDSTLDNASTGGYRDGKAAFSWKIASSEPSTWTFQNQSADCCVLVMAFRNVYAASPFEEATLTNRIYGTPSQFGLWPGITSVGGGDFNALGSARELGHTFTADVNCNCTGIRYYNFSADETGTHVARLWENAGGTLIAGPFNLTPSGPGWNTVEFATPVSLTAGASYTVSVTTGADAAKLFTQISDAAISAEDLGYVSRPANSGRTGTSIGSRPTTATGHSYLRDVMIDRATGTSEVPVPSITTVGPHRTHVVWVFENDDSGAWGSPVAPSGMTLGGHIAVSAWLRQIASYETRAAAGATGSKMQTIPRMSYQDRVYQFAIKPAVQAVDQALNATVGTTATIHRAVGKQIILLPSYLVSLRKTAGKPLVASAPSAGTVAKGVGKAVAATAPSLGIMVRRTGKPLEVVQAPAATVQKGIAHILPTAAAASIAVLRLGYGRLLFAAQGSTASIRRAIGKGVNLAISPAATLVPHVVRRVFLSVSQGTAASMGRLLAIRRALSASAGTGASMRRAISLTRTVGAPSVASMARHTLRQRLLAVNATVGASLGKAIAVSRVVQQGTLASLSALKSRLQLLFATASTSVSLRRGVGKSLSAAAGTAADLRKNISRLLTVAAASNATLVAGQLYVRLLAVTASTSASLGRGIAKRIETAASTAATLRKAHARVFIAAVNTTASLTKSSARLLAATAASTATLIKHRAVLLVASVGSVASLFAGRTIIKVLFATVETSASMSKAVSKWLTAEATTIASLAVSTLQTFIEGVGKAIKATRKAGATFKAKVSGGTFKARK